MDNGEWFKNWKSSFTNICVYSTVAVLLSYQCTVWRHVLMGFNEIMPTCNPPEWNPVWLLTAPVSPLRKSRLNLESFGIITQTNTKKTLNKGGQRLSVDTSNCFHVEQSLCWCKSGNLGKTTISTRPEPGADAFVHTHFARMLDFAVLP